MLPYVTAAEVVRICQELMAGSSEPESKNKYPVLNYTLDELKQYDGVSSEEVPDEVIGNIDTYAAGVDLCASTYVEFQTKDGYTFKGTMAPCMHDFEGTLPIDTSNLVCYEDGSKFTVIKYATIYDDETGDGRVEFAGIQCGSYGE